MEIIEERIVEKPVFHYPDTDEPKYTEDYQKPIKNFHFLVQKI